MPYKKLIATISVVLLTVLLGAELAYANFFASDPIVTAPTSDEIPSEFGPFLLLALGLVGLVAARRYTARRDSN